MKISIDTTSSSILIHDEIVDFVPNTLMDITAIISNLADFSAIEFDLKSNNFSGFVVTERTLNSSKKTVKSNDELTPDEVTYTPTAPKFAKGKKSSDLLKIIEDRYRSAMLSSIVAWANGFTAPITSKYPQVVQAGFDKKRDEASAIISASESGGDVEKAISETNIISEIKTQASITNEEVIGLCERIIQKASEYSKLSVAVEMMQTQAENVIKGANGIEALYQTQQRLKQKAGELASKFGLGG